MYFDPFHENLFGAPLWVWLGVALVWLGPFLFFRIIEPHQNRRDERRTRNDPPTEADGPA